MRQCTKEVLHEVSVEHSRRIPNAITYSLCHRVKKKPTRSMGTPIQLALHASALHGTIFDIVSHIVQHFRYRCHHFPKLLSYKCVLGNVFRVAAQSVLFQFEQILRLQHLVLDRLHGTRFHTKNISQSNDAIFELRLKRTNSSFRFSCAWIASMCAANSR